MDIELSTDVIHRLLLIRQGTKADLPALEWEGEFSHFRLLYADIFKSTQEGLGLIWIAELPEKAGLIGQLFVSLKGARAELADGSGRAYIFGFRVRPEYRNLGIGKRIMSIVEEDLDERGYRWVTLNAGKENYAAQRFYEQLGYQVVAGEPGRWSYIDDKHQRREVYEPAWRMEKKIGR
jgi:ribosomal protein S18 acetylase RimI-like enzyme